MARLTIEDSTIHSLFFNNGITDAFPFLKTAATRSQELANKPACCGHKGQLDYNSLKAAIATMGPEQQTLFKNLLNVDIVQVFYRVGSNVNEVNF